MKKLNKSLKNLCSILIVVIVMFSLSACKASEEEKKLNIFLDTTDEHSTEVIKFLIDDYEKSNPDVEVKLNDVLGDKGDIVEKINVGTKVDVIFTNRNNLIELSQKGVLSDLQGTYDENALSDRYYDILGSYGRVGDKYYGIGVVPYSIELLYNKANLKKLNISDPSNSKQWLKALKQINGKGIKTTVALTDDVDANGYLFSLVAGNVINIHELEENYDSGEESYKKLKDMQEIFKEFNSLTKENEITKNSFELGNEQSIINFNNSESPLLVSISYYNSKLKENNIGIVGDYDDDSKYGSNAPVIVNSLICVPVNAKNPDTADEFIKYIYSDKVQAKLVQKGIISGNKIVNNKISGIGKLMVQHMYKANDNSMLILYNLPAKIKNNLILALEKILDGNYNSKEWENVLKKSYK
ncbi:extracellular solute-binding protein [Clostridium algoriphilum]|uniref:ABC transporter substrate-binding protein n=1 Tax=Clostridium algoriphilum TaxID=198347 RepID=UPI001CF1432E|nr:extracellular solute-binding protein [Clostridium algoriphilum]MCB2292941.1 extracellular solute-binding protein [Clostridium algoriphilum]